MFSPTLGFFKQPDCTHCSESLLFQKLWNGASNTKSPTFHAHPWGTRYHTSSASRKAKSKVWIWQQAKFLERWNVPAFKLDLLSWKSRCLKCPLRSCSELEGIPFSVDEWDDCSVLLIRLVLKLPVKNFNILPCSSLLPLPWVSSPLNSSEIQAYLSPWRT